MLTKCKRNAHACTEGGTDCFRGGQQVLKFCVWGINLFSPGGQSISKSLVQGDCFKGGPNLS